jgi:hypothetical protein
MINVRLRLSIGTTFLSVNTPKKTPLKQSSIAAFPARIVTPRGKVGVSQTGAFRLKQLRF